MCVHGQGSPRPFHHVIALQRDAEKRFRTKERELQQKLKETQQRIARMQVQRSGSGEQILTPEQQKEIAEFRLTANKTEQQLREVQANLRKDIDKLDTQLKFFNIGLVPILWLPCWPYSQDGCGSASVTRAVASNKHDF